MIQGEILGEALFLEYNVTFPVVEIQNLLASFSCAMQVSKEKIDTIDNPEG